MSFEGLPDESSLRQDFRKQKKIYFPTQEEDVLIMPAAPDLSALRHMPPAPRQTTDLIKHTDHTEIIIDTPPAHYGPLTFTTLQIP